MKNKENFKIDSIKLDFMDDEIDKIINKGVREKLSFFKYIKGMYKELGFKVVFHDISELLIVTALIASIIFIMTMGVVANPKVKMEEVYGVMFCTAPLIYLATSLYSFFSSKQRGTFEVEVTCKFSIYQIAALRMFIFSIVTILIDTLIIGALFLLKDDFSFIRAWIISISAVFTFSYILLFSITKIKSRYVKYVIFFGWVIGNLSLNFYLKGLARFIFLKLPFLVHLGITVIFLFFYIRNLKKLIKFRSNRGEI